jgi:hypothetical protein
MHTRLLDPGRLLQAIQIAAVRLSLDIPDRAGASSAPQLRFCDLGSAQNDLPPFEEA